MDAIETTTDRKVRREAETNNAFQEALARSEIKLLLSMVPPTEPRELLETLMRSIFAAGVVHGEGAVAGEMIGALLKGMDKKQARDSGY